ncbi:MAG: hypothetical protein LBP19_03940 [Treponema sp.]|nr:hypothetical protein [Treponema sp.]
MTLIVYISILYTEARRWREAADTAATPAVKPYTIVEEAGNKLQTS